MTSASAKRKGRRGAAEVRALLLLVFPFLQPDDVKVKVTSEPGSDLHLSPHALASFPYGIECKVVEKVNIWDALRQAAAQCPPGLEPVVFFRRNRSRMYVALDAAHFLSLVSRGPS